MRSFGRAAIANPSLRQLLATVAAACALSPVLLADLTSIKTEPNPVHRALRALDYADSMITTAREHYEKGQESACTAALHETGAAVEIAHDALMQTGKDPQRSPKNFKTAETRTRGLLRRLHALENDMDAADREAVVVVIEIVQTVHDAWLEGILEKREKK